MRMGQGHDRPEGDQADPEEEVMDHRPAPLPVVIEGEATQVGDQGQSTLPREAVPGKIQGGDDHGLPGALDQGASPRDGAAPRQEVGLSIRTAFGDERRCFPTSGKTSFPRARSKTKKKGKSPVRSPSSRTR